MVGREIAAPRRRSGSGQVRGRPPAGRALEGLVSRRRRGVRAARPRASRPRSSARPSAATRAAWPSSPSTPPRRIVSRAGHVRVSVSPTDRTCQSRTATTALGNECLPHRCRCPLVRAVNRWNLVSVQLLGDLGQRHPTSTRDRRGGRIGSRLRRPRKQ